MHQPVRGIRNTFLHVIEDFMEYITFEISEFAAYKKRQYQKRLLLIIYSKIVNSTERYFEYMLCDVIEYDTIVTSKGAAFNIVSSYFSLHLF